MPQPVAVVAKQISHSPNNKFKLSLCDWLFLVLVSGPISIWLQNWDCGWFYVRGPIFPLSWILEVCQGSVHALFIWACFWELCGLTHVWVSCCLFASLQLAPPWCRDETEDDLPRLHWGCQHLFWQTHTKSFSSAGHFLSPMFEASVLLLQFLNSSSLW